MKTRFCASLSVMKLIRVQYQNRTRNAMTLGITVMETLHTIQGDPNGISIVSMGCITVATKIGFDTLYFSWLSSVLDPIVTCRFGHLIYHLKLGLI